MSEVEDEIKPEAEVTKPEIAKPDPEIMMTPLRRGRRASATSTDSEEVSPVRRVRRKSQKAASSNTETDKKEQVELKVEETPGKRRGRPSTSSKL